MPSLRGVIAAIPTPIDGTGSPDHGRLVRFASRMLDGGCDGLNILGTTGEATSFSVDQRLGVMQSIAKSDLPLDRLMVGTGAASLDDATRLTKAAAELGFAGALLLPPFYYKAVPEEGVFRFVSAIIDALKERPLDIYLYNFPALSGVAYTEALTERLVTAFPQRVRGLKDSSGNLDYARAVASLSNEFSVFPSSESVLLEARAGVFAGCISATANLNAALCARAFHHGDELALEKAVAIRQLFDGRPLIPGVKALVGYLEGDEGFTRPLPPLIACNAQERATLIKAFESITGGE